VTAASSSFENASTRRKRLDAQRDLRKMQRVDHANAASGEPALIACE